MRPSAETYRIGLKMNINTSICHIQKLHWLEAADTCGAESTFEPLLSVK